MSHVLMSLVSITFHPSALVSGSAKSRELLELEDLRSIGSGDRRHGTGFHLSHKLTKEYAQERPHIVLCRTAIQSSRDKVGC